MPIYEFYCQDCHTIFNFFSKGVNVSKQPKCPRCKKRTLSREISLFSTAKAGAGEEGPESDLPFDDAKMGQAMEALASEAEGMSEDDPKAAVALMRKFSNMTGVEFGDHMQEALRRMEAGEDPEAIESEMGSLLEEEEPFILPQEGTESPKTEKRQRGKPRHDPTLYDL